MGKQSYSLKQALAGRLARKHGIDPSVTMAAGDAAAPVMDCLSRAAATAGKERAKYIAEVQRGLRRLDAQQHATLINAVQAKLLALQGRGGDTEVAHVTPGEMVIPRSLLTPEMVHLIASEAERQGFDPDRFVVGGQGTFINPHTGAQEFASLAEDERNRAEAYLRARDLSDWRDQVRLPAPSSITNPLPSRMPNSIAETREATVVRPPSTSGAAISVRPRVTQSGGIDKMRDYMEPVGAVVDVLSTSRGLPKIGRFLERAEPVADAVGYTADAVDVAGRVVGSNAASQPQGSGSMLGTLYDAADRTYSVAGNIGLVSGVSGLAFPIAAPVLEPIAGAAGLTSATGLGAREALSWYCRNNGLGDDCRRR